MVMIKYYYTKIGEIYSGFEFDEFNYPEYTIVIQASKLKEYQILPQSEKTLEKIAEYGWVLAKDSIAGTLDQKSFSPPYSQREGLMKSSAFERKYMFVFGAGASANCAYEDAKEFYADNLRPPLGISLFEKRFKAYYDNYKGVRYSLPYLQKPNFDVEDFFEKEWDEISKQNNESVLSRHINIQYYLREILKDVSNHVIEQHYEKNLYSIFFNKLQKIYNRSRKRTTYGETSSKNFSFVSFNQDTILEHFAYEIFKKEFKTMDDYISVNEGVFSLFKPHGSWNWGWQFPNTSILSNNMAEWLYDKNTNLFEIHFNLLGNHIDMVDWDMWGTSMQFSPHALGKYTINKSKLQLIDKQNLNNYFPALLLPYLDKDEFVMPLTHFREMQQYIHGIETLVLIGWKGNEAAFNELLYQQANRLKKIIIVNPTPDIVKQNLTKLLSKFKIEPIIYDTFEDFVESGLDKEII